MTETSSDSAETIAALRGAVPDFPRDTGGPVFAAPWEAQAFAMTLALHEQGAFSWKEWTETLAAVIAEVRQRGEMGAPTLAAPAAALPAKGEQFAPWGGPAAQMDTGEHYYRHWLTALERITIRQGLVADAELVQRRKDWEEAARATPHGQPIRLKDA